MKADGKQVEILKSGASAWSEWREKHPQVEIILNHAKLTGANLRGIDLSGAQLHGALLQEADLTGASLQSAGMRKAQVGMANLSKANLRGTDLSRANLRRCIMIGTDLSDAKLRHAHLHGAVMSGAKLESTDFFSAAFGGTTFADLDFSQASGLFSCIHVGPSSIDFHSLKRSRGLGRDFLRGCGLPDIYIDYLPDFFSPAIVYASCFISHSTKDKDFCWRLYDVLRKQGVMCWYFPEDAVWGEPVWAEIDKGINIYDRLIVVCSKSSLASGPVLREVERALQREDREQKNILFPITLDDFVFGQWQHSRKADVTQKVCGSFQGWESNTVVYTQALNKLLKGLKTRPAGCGNLV